MSRTVPMSIAAASPKNPGVGRAFLLRPTQTTPNRKSRVRGPRASHATRFPGGDRPGPLVIDDRFGLVWSLDVVYQTRMANRKPG